ncbi:hypothetical protein TNCV_3777851 [Trichonephila clavipes]|nr:hypothetical protein TNCV_3777851 [Trichonephila clavipes]
MKGIYVLFPTHQVAWMTSKKLRVTDELFGNDVTRVKWRTEKQAIRTTFRKFSGLFTKTDKSTAAKTNVKHRIFTGDHAPINQRAYRVAD